MRAAKVPANAAMARMINEHGVLGSTVAGIQWARRALHPCDDSLGGAVAIPTTGESNTVPVEDRSTHIMVAPDSVGTSLWDIQIVTLPVADLSFAWRTKLSTATTWGDWTGVSDTGGFNAGTFQVGTGSTDPQPLTTPDLLLNETTFRATHKGITCILNANALSDQGLLTAGQYGGKPTDENLRPVLHGYTGTNTQESSHLIFDDVPQSSTALVKKVPQAGQWEARKGLYMPIRFEDDSHPFNGGQITEWSGTANDVIQTGCPMLLRPSGATAAADYLLNVIYAPGTTNLVVTAGPVNMNLGVIFFEGLSAQASVLVKVREGLEVVANSDNILASAAKVPPPDDELARKAVQNVGRELPMVFEHKYNSANWLLPLLKKAAAAVGPHLGRFFTGLTGVPLA